MIAAVILGLIGDLEGEQSAAVSCLRLLGERGDVDVACQLGDLRFGMGLDPEGYLAAIESVCAEFGLRLLCINGNHENWARLDRLWAEPVWQHEDGSPKPINVSDHVTLLPRGHRWEMGGRSFVALGGAPSINRHLLTEGVDWWPSEVIEDEHVEATISGGYAEVMLTHDSPGPPYCTEPVADTIQNNPCEWPASSRAYAQDGIDKVTRAVLGVRPLLLAHGHFHVAGNAVVRLPGAARTTTIWSLAARHDPGTVRLLDLDTLTDAGQPVRAPSRARHDYLAKWGVDGAARTCARGLETGFQAQATPEFPASARPKGPRVPGGLWYRGDSLA